jgi:C4-dicarboxylate-specific signal transduction histidine kinase
MAQIELTEVSLSREQLARINRTATVARFVSSLAHELNNSLQVMSGLVELLVERNDLPPDVHARIESIGAQADRASDRIRQVASYVREPGVAEERVDLGVLVERALALRSYELARSGIDVQWASPGGAWAVRGSARELRQAVLNLLANAQEALADSASRVLRVQLTRATGILRLTVADSGPGVAADLRERIFDPFFTTRGAAGALGLGLTVAAHTAAAYGGRLVLERERPGASFLLELPDAG